MVVAVQRLVPDDGAARQAFTELRPVDKESLVERGGHTAQVTRDQRGLPGVSAHFQDRR